MKNKKNSLIDFSLKEIGDIFSILKTNEKGLSSNEVELRLAKDGLNDVEAKNDTLLKIFIGQFANFLMLLLLFGVISSFFLGEVKDALVILFLLLVNGVLGTIQEYRANKLTRALKKHIQQVVKVRRDGEEKIIHKIDLVLGDIIILENGQVVPADARIIKSFGLFVDESAMTGESVKVLKSYSKLENKPEGVSGLSNILFAGTIVSAGLCEAVVVATGKDTEFGKITGLTHSSKKKSTFLTQINKLSKFLFHFSLIVTVLLFLALVLFKPDIGMHNTFLFVIALAIAIEPEMLPLVSTIIVTKVSLKLSQKGVLIKRLSAIEDLGGVDIICTDKTGTLTKNILKIKDIVSANPGLCLKNALVASTKIADKDNLIFGSFDQAIFEKSDTKIIDEIKNTNFIWKDVFNSEYLWQFSVVENNDEYEISVKGAPESLIKRCSLSQEEKNSILKQVEDFGHSGLRVLCIASTKTISKDKYSQEDLKDLKFLGLITFEDPIKDTAREALANADKLGVNIKILTGDSLEVARSVAKEVGLNIKDEEIISGQEFLSSDEETKAEMCKRGIIFARVDPSTKHEIVTILSKNKSVLFLGDGINDAPSLRVANVGMVVEDASDIAKESADIILTKPDLLSIVEAVELGRSSINSISKYISINMTQNFGELYTIVFLIAVMSRLPILPTQLLMIDFLTELIIPLIVLGNISRGSAELKKPIKINVRKTSFHSIFFAFAIMSAQVLLYFLFKDSSAELFRTLWTIQMILLLFVMSLSLRSSGFFWKAASLPLRNKIMLVSIGLFVVFSPFISPLNEWLSLESYDLLLIVPILVTLLFSLIILEISKIKIFKGSMVN